MQDLRKQFQSFNYKVESKLKPQFFTRNRKLRFESLVLMILNMLRRTLQIEIDEFMNNIVNKDTDQNYTKQAFSGARQKLSPKAFTMLNDTLLEKYYSDDDF